MIKPKINFTSIYQGWIMVKPAKKILQFRVLQFRRFIWLRSLHPSMI